MVVPKVMHGLKDKVYILGEMIPGFMIVKELYDNYSHEEAERSGGIVDPPSSSRVLPLATFKTLRALSSGVMNWFITLLTVSSRVLPYVAVFSQY